MDVFSADLPIGAFSKVPPPIARPGDSTRDTAAQIVDALARAERPVIYAGGGVLSARATAELAALAEALEVPVAHTLMGKGCLHETHPLLLGQTGFWGTPIANDTCRNADVILAVGTRLAEANSSSWDPRFTFAMPPTRLIHIDADPAEIGRNYPTELGVVADAKLALAALAAAATRRSAHRSRGALRAEIASGRQAFAANWAHQWTSNQFPMRPERILRELRKAVPEDGFIVTDVGWNKNGVAQQFPITVPGTFITPSGLATMGFGPAAVLGVKLAQPDRAAVALVGDGGFSANPSVVATAMEAELPVIWLVMDNNGVRHDCRPRVHALRLELRLPVRARRPALRGGLRGHGAVVRRARRHDQRGRRARAGARRGARVGPADGDSGADGERADAHARTLGHQRRLSLRRIDVCRVTAPESARGDRTAAGRRGGAGPEADTRRTSSRAFCAARRFSRPTA